MCFAWQRNLLALHVVSDALIAIAYFSIPVTLCFFILRRRDLPCRWLFAMFATFIVACGATHVLAIWTVWHPDYWIEGALKAFTAVVSLATAVECMRLVPQALALKSPQQLEELNRQLVFALTDVTEMKAREMAQRDYAHQLQSLHLIASMTAGKHLEQIEAALAVPVEALGLQHGYLAAVDRETNLVDIACSVSDGSGAGASPETFLRDASREGTLLTFDRPGADSYIAVPIVVDGNAYGAAGFTGAPRSVPFSPENVQLVTLAADLIASALQRGLQTERLDALAFSDDLTGLPNRVFLYDRLAQTIRAAERRDEHFAVLFLDLDGFKSVNDRFGHIAGDHVLKNIAARLLAVLRDSDTAVRLGGDEFVMICAGVATVRDATQFAERILEAASEPIADGDREYRLTASIGVSFYPADGTDIETLIDRADCALYYAKHAGKNQVRFAREEQCGQVVESAIAGVGARQPLGAAERKEAL